MYKEYKAKSVLNIHKNCDGGWFWHKYSAFPYKGCAWGCSYCFAREARYNPHKNNSVEIQGLADPFSELIKIKLDSPVLLEKALSKKPKDLIYIDSYQPAENKYHLIRQMLEVCDKLGFPVFINEKSDQVINDIDILKRISQRNYVNVGWSIVFGQDNKIKMAFEPKSPSIQSRFSAMRQLSEDGIYTGTVMMPVLPYICDSDENLELIIKETAEAGGKYILYGGLSLYGYCKTFFYQFLEDYDKTLISKYDILYSDDSAANIYVRDINLKILKLCKKYKLSPFIERPVNFYPKRYQNNKMIAGKLFLNARHIGLMGENKYKQWAYMKAANEIDRLDEDISSIYVNGGREAVLKIPGIGESIADKIIELCN